MQRCTRDLSEGSTSAIIPEAVPCILMLKMKVKRVESIRPTYSDARKAKDASGAELARMPFFWTSVYETLSQVSNSVWNVDYLWFVKKRRVCHQSRLQPLGCRSFLFHSNSTTWGKFSTWPMSTRSCTSRACSSSLMAECHLTLKSRWSKQETTKKTAPKSSRLRSSMRLSQRRWRVESHSADLVRLMHKSD
jgi:hypothetical protein